MEPPQALVSEATRMDVPIQVRINATAVALERVSIRVSATGFLKELLYYPGANVRRGQLLFVIYEKPFEADLDTNTVLLARVHAALAEAKQSSAREIAKQLLNVAEAQWQVALIEEKRASAPLEPQRHLRCGSQTPDRASDSGRGPGRGRKDWS